MYHFRPRTPAFCETVLNKKTGSSSTPERTATRKTPQQVEQEKKQKQQERKDRKKNFLQGGGPFERAIRQDYLALYHAFCLALADKTKNVSAFEKLSETEDEFHLSSSVGRGLGRWNSYYRLEPHGSTGLAFQCFKRVSRGAGGNGHPSFFSQLYSKESCSPPRCDLVAYHQILYAACFAMMEEFNGSCDHPRIHNGSGHHPEKNQKIPCAKQRKSMEKAVFGVFIMYALYTTNPLPEPVPLEPPLHKNITKNGCSKNSVESIAESSPVYTGFTDHERNVLRMLPMGVQTHKLVHQPIEELPTKDGSKRRRRGAAKPQDSEETLQQQVIANRSKQERRAFRSKIRIDRYHYLKLQQLRDACLRVMSLCEHQRCADALHHLSCVDKDETQPSEEKQKRKHGETSWKCVCHVAKDGVQILDRLQSGVDPGGVFEL